VQPRTVGRSKEVHSPFSSPNDLDRGLEPGHAEKLLKLAAATASRFVGGAILTFKQLIENKISFGEKSGKSSIPSG
jgi:hypothetical protein